MKKVNISKSDPEIRGLSHGQIGVGTWRARAYFDDVKVTPLE